MTGQSKPRPPVGPLVMAGFAVLGAGLIAWMWLGDWRYAATAAVMFVVLAAVSGPREGRQR
ncbi:hypothetical protein [Pseudonocardia parietis]|uniref:Uncharacterized protein n=1 Tax=Pseudonocardia parietis TaxID=570936 RepID=A0ABS4W246_9PSEU|nr:hypothetical protein [Pseudonocardia parietis]MBP2370282.1 hypothetical protein [Pseudonocardia parietis]